MIKHSLSMNANQLKLLAICAMVTDHCASVLLTGTGPVYWAMRLFGRIAAPIMCFFIAEGFYYTSNLKRYMGRLLFMAIVSHAAFNLCFGMNVWEFWRSTDVMFSLFLGLAALAVWNKAEISLWMKCAVIAGCRFPPFTSEYFWRFP